MNVLQNLVELYNHLPQDNTYRGIAGTILQHLPEMKEISVYDVAEMADASRTTVWRMVQMMGYENFTDFRYALQQAASKYSYYNRIFSEPDTHSSDQILNSCEKDMKRAIKLTRQLMTEPQVERLCGKLHMASSVCFYLPFQSYTVCSFQQNLSMDAKKTSYQCLKPNMQTDAEKQDEKSIVFISAIEYAETMDITPVLGELRKRKAEIWLLAEPQSRYSAMADEHLLNVQEEHYTWCLLMENFFTVMSENYRRLYLQAIFT